MFRSVFKEQISLGLQKLFLQKLFFRYSKVFILQWKLKYKKEEEAYQGGSIIDEATEEMRRAISLKAVEALPMPDEVSDESAASAFVNPLTALGLARPVIKGRHRAMIHTAGASQLGRMLIRLSNRHAFPLINIVHRDALVAELQADGAKHVLDSSRADFQESLTSLARDLKAT